MKLLTAGAVVGLLAIAGGYVYFKAGSGATQQTDDAQTGSPATASSAGAAPAAASGAKPAVISPVTITPEQLSSGGGPKVQSNAAPVFQANEQPGLSYDVKPTDSGARLLGVGANVSLAPALPQPAASAPGAATPNAGSALRVGGPTVSAGAASPSALMLNTNPAVAPIDVRIPALEGGSQAGAAGFAQPGFGAGVTLPTSGPLGPAGSIPTVPKIGGGNPFGPGPSISLPATSPQPTPGK